MDPVFDEAEAEMDDAELWADLPHAHAAAPPASFDGSGDPAGVSVNNNTNSGSAHLSKNEHAPSFAPGVTPRAAGVGVTAASASAELPKKPATFSFAESLRRAKALASASRESRSASQDTSSFPTNISINTVASNSSIEGAGAAPPFSSLPSSSDISDCTLASDSHASGGDCVKGGDKTNTRKKIKYSAATAGADDNYADGDDAESSVGVCALPPRDASAASFLVRGDNGVVRWVTATALDRRRRRDGREQRRYQRMLRHHRSLKESTSVNGKRDSGENEEAEEEEETSRDPQQAHTRNNKNNNNEYANFSSSSETSFSDDSDADSDDMDGDGKRGVPSIASLMRLPGETLAAGGNGSRNGNNHSPASNALLGDSCPPIAVMKQEILEEMKERERARLEKEAESADAAAHASSEIDLETAARQRAQECATEAETTIPSHPQRHNPTSHNSYDADDDSGNNNNSLWVDRYRPAAFRDVLSDDNINLQLLQWLKSWDAYVFRGAGANGRARRGAGGRGAATPDPLSAAASAAATTNLDNISHSNNSSAAAAAEPPEERLAVMVGPPGVGKTTLAHVLGAHCGYEVLEVNASVERTTSRVESIIRTAVTPTGSGGGTPSSSHPTHDNSDDAFRSSHPHSDLHPSEHANTGGGSSSSSLADRLRRPKLLVMDEMDGLTSQVTQFLLAQDIRRPVLCLCNDLYAPALRLLRQRVTHVYHLPPIRPQRLLARLEEICDKEGMSVSQAALAELVQLSNGDVRSCLNTLQFMKSAPPPPPPSSSHALTNGTSGSGNGGTVSSGGGGGLGLMRETQGKDSKVDMWKCWSTVFFKNERSRSIQLLKKECGVDYEKMLAEAHAYSLSVAAAKRYKERAGVTVARGHPSISLTAGGPGSSSSLSTPNTASTTTNTTTSGGAHSSSYAASSSAPSQRHTYVAHPPSRGARGPAVVAGFRVDAGYLYASHVLPRCADYAALLDGLRENYLSQPTTDYSFARTTTAADALARQDVMLAAAFSHAPSLVGFAESYQVQTALWIYCACASSTGGGGNSSSSRLRFPREGQQLHQRLAESTHIAASFREGMRDAAAATHLCSAEAAAAELCPFLLRCLVPTARVKMPAHPISSLAALPPAERAAMDAAVARHWHYGLTYRHDAVAAAAAAREAELQQQQPQQHHHQGPSKFPGSGPNAGNNNNVGGGAGGKTVWSLRRAAARHEWILSPNIELISGAQRDFSVGAAGGGGEHRFQNRPSKWNWGGGGGSAGGGGYAASAAPSSLSSSPSSSAAAAAHTPVSPLQGVSDDIRQLMVAAIAQLDIRRAAEAAQRRARVRPREDAENDETETEKEKNNKQLTGANKEEGKEDGASKTNDTTTTSSSQAEGPPLKKERREGEESAPITATSAATVVKKDFFGRPITTPPATASSGKSGGGGILAMFGGAKAKKGAGGRGGSLASPGGGGGGRKVTVRYIYQDGATNAVKMPASFSDF